MAPPRESVLVTLSLLEAVWQPNNYFSESRAHRSYSCTDTVVAAFCSLAPRRTRHYCSPVREFDPVNTTRVYFCLGETTLRPELGRALRNGTTRGGPDSQSVLHTRESVRIDLLLAPS